jgi:hypothetical protein
LKIRRRRRWETKARRTKVRRKPKSLRKTSRRSKKKSRQSAAGNPRLFYLNSLSVGAVLDSWAGKQSWIDLLGRVVDEKFTAILQEGKIEVPVTQSLVRLGVPGQVIGSPLETSSSGAELISKGK